MTGRLRVSEWERDGRHGTNVELMADAIGHDLTFGRTVYTKNAAVSAVPISTPASIDAPIAPENAPDAVAVDSDGWALPGGQAASDADSAGPQEGVSDEGETIEEPDEQQLMFAQSEPPF